jgi:hypothetical protein
MNRVIIGLVILAVAFLGFNWYQGPVDNTDVGVNDFESCAIKTGEVMESHPRKCRFEGKTYVEELAGEVYDWQDDGVSLAIVKETGEYACFGCNNVLCVDPVLDGIEWEEEIRARYCSDEFEVVEG